MKLLALAFCQALDDRTREHSIRVSKNFTGASEIVALLHDCVEDEVCTLHDIHQLFGQEIAEAVDAISRRDGEVYWNYIARAKENSIAREVKLADLSDNLRDCSSSLRNRYLTAQAILS